MAIPDARIRQAALALHGLGAADRQRVLELLGDTHRQRLQPLLAELQALGIPAALSPPTAGVADEGEGPASAQARLAGLPTTAVASLLGVSPPAISAAVLAAGGSDWAAGVLKAMSPAHRCAVEAALAGGYQPGPKLVRALCAQVVASAGGALPASPAAVRAASMAPMKRAWPWRR